MGEQLREGAPVAQPPVVSRTGGITVRTTERGLPTRLKISAAEMSRAPEDLTREILSLCPLSAMRLQVARRRELRMRDFSCEVIRGLNLVTEEELAPTAQQASRDGDGPPDTWMGSA